MKNWEEHKSNPASKPLHNSNQPLHNSNTPPKNVSAPLPSPSKFCTPPGPKATNRQISNDFRGEEHTKKANDINDIHEIPSVPSELDSVVDP